MSARPDTGARLRLLALYPTFWPRQGGGQMVLAAIAEGLADRVTTEVLTRRFADTGARREYEHLAVHYFPNPAPEVWKDYATGTRPETHSEWLIELGEEGVSWRRGHEKATVALRGPLTSVLLAFYRRLPLDAPGLDVLGDRKLLEFWLERATFG